jgi:hypothetical protein
LIVQIKVIIHEVILSKIYYDDEDDDDEEEEKYSNDIHNYSTSI